MSPRRAARPPTLDRRCAVAAVLQARQDALVITGLGAPTWDAAAAGDHPGTFYLWGGMGGAAVMGLGKGDLEARVRELLDPHQRRGLSAVALVGCSAALCLFALFATHGLHYLAQALLRLP